MIETIGDALRERWRIEVRCAFGKRDGMKSVRECRFSSPLDVQTLAWTRGADMPLDMLTDRMKCPMCGSRRVRLVFRGPDDRIEMRATPDAWA